MFLWTTVVVHCLLGAMSCYAVQSNTISRTVLLNNSEFRPIRDTQPRIIAIKEKAVPDHWALTNACMRHKPLVSLNKYGFFNGSLPSSNILDLKSSPVLYTINAHMQVNLSWFHKTFNVGFCSSHPAFIEVEAWLVVIHPLHSANHQF